MLHWDALKRTVSPCFSRAERRSKLVSMCTSSMPRHLLGFCRQKPAEGPLATDEDN